MAEPLLRKTFSRLRGKEKARRKTDPKDRDATAKAACGETSHTQSCCPADETSKRGTFITVAKKQNWAKLSPACREQSCLPSSACPRAPGLRSQEWDSSAGKSPAYEKGLKSISSCCTVAPTTQSIRVLDSQEITLHAPRLPSSKGLTEQGVPELQTPVLSYSELSTSSSSIKITGQGAYLQSLDRSSRAWVLSSGKPQASEEGLRPPLNCITERRPRRDEESKGDIWYNPIPEEEDPRRFCNPWKRREGRGSPECQRGVTDSRRVQRAVSTARPTRAPGCDTLGVDAQPPSSCSDIHSPRATNQLAATRMDSQAQDSAGARNESADILPAPAPVVSPGGPPPSDSPAAQKKPGVMERIRSPGTVRSLSMRMRKLPELRRKLSLRSSRTRQGTGDGTSPQNARKESGNVISRYHLDTSVSAGDGPRRRRISSKRGKSASKGGYLSDGDSPELLPKHDSAGEPQQEQRPDPAAFRPYSLADQPRCAQRLSGLLSVHLSGLEEVKSPRVDSKEVFCAIQVDGVTRARTALLTCRASFLSLNHTFNLELENAQLLKLVVSSWDSGANRNRVCCLGAVAIPPLFRGSRAQQLAVKLEPRGLLFVKMTLVEQWDVPPRPSDREPRVFGVELRHLVDKEASAVKVPLLIQKSVSEIEKRGLKVVGLYRLCGSAAVKKELRDAFEKDSTAVNLSEELYPDINVVTGILKDYLRELPSPLITNTLYEVVLDAMSKRPPKSAPNRPELEPQRSAQTVSLLNCLPEVEKATLTVLLNHLSRVASFSGSNRMTSQNLAVCFGPVLLTPSLDPSRQGAGRSFAHSEEIASAVDFKRHIEALHYLLQLWPLPSKDPVRDSPVLDQPVSQSSLQPRPRPLLHLDLPKDSVVSRRGRGRLESPPCNRYAGDWSVCGRDFLPAPEADYDEVAATDSEEEEGERGLWGPQGNLFPRDFSLDPKTIDLDAPFTTRLSLKDFDTLISDLERELAKQIHICL
ncbi:rho GTPase-activating protein SYDE1-like [Huso huso]|uniref:Rho GTPase-activating protein SYDE1-like n=1 Tax=Huso huso TaxID=61971 RepID=A0ABR0Y8K8_HUSHU